MNYTDVIEESIQRIFEDQWRKDSFQTTVFPLINKKKNHWL